MPFNMKEWLDANVVPLTKQEPVSRIYSFIWNGTPPKEILVWLLVGTEAATAAADAAAVTAAFDPAVWPALVHRLLTKDDFRFDYLREQIMVSLAGGMVPVFGGDGAPLLSEKGMVSVRLFRKIDDISLILQIGCQYPATDRSAEKNALAAIKAFFALFGEENALGVCAKYGAVFGQA